MSTCVPPRGQFFPPEMPLSPRKTKSVNIPQGPRPKIPKPGRSQLPRHNNQKMPSKKNIINRPHLWQKFAQMFVRGQFSDSKAYFLETKEAFHDQEFVQVVANSVNHGISSYHFSIIESPKN